MSKKFTETTKWADPWFRSLTAKQKCLWLWLCDNCDCAGVVPEIDWGLVSFQIGEPCDERDLEAFRDRLEACGSRFWIRKYVAFQWGYISEEKPPAPHRGVLKALARVGIPLAKAMERVPKPLPKPYERLKDKDKDKDKEQGLVQIEDRVKGKGKEIDAKFDAFWSSYPRKVAKAAAKKAFDKLTDKDAVVSASAAYAAAVALWSDEDKQFVPHPATWLNDGRFEDDPSTWARNGKVAPREMYGNDYFKRRDEIEAEKERKYQERLAREKAAHEAALAGAAEVCADLLADDPNQ